MVSIVHITCTLDSLSIAPNQCNADGSWAPTLHCIMHSSKESRMTLLWWLVNEGSIVVQCPLSARECSACVYGCPVSPALASAHPVACPRCLWWPFLLQQPPAAPDFSLLLRLDLQSSAHLRTNDPAE